MRSNFAQAVRGLSKHGDVQNDEFASTVNKTETYENNSAGTQPDAVVVSTTKISSTMEVYGEIKSKDAIQSAGQIFGNVTTTQSFSSKSLTVGNIAANSVAVKQGRIKGDVTAIESMDLGVGSIMVGDINSGDLYLSGKVKGNCDIKHDATLLTGSLLVGNIVADNITTEQGARINGNVTMRNDDTILDIEAEFDLGGDF